MSQQFACITIPTEKIDNFEMFSAWAHFFDVDSIVENEETVDLYCSAFDSQEIVNGLIEKLQMQKDDFAIVQVKNENWNSLWESNFDVVKFDNWIIKAAFHTEEAENEILIKPQMAFGTGHHETTFMMLKTMNSLHLENLRMLDYGCGTGILSIFAAMKGAAKIDAIDIQEEAIENTIEHVELNNINIDIIKPVISDIDPYLDQSYDFILANINRNVLSQNVDKVCKVLKEEGTLLMSGILKSDEQMITEMYINAGLKLVDKHYKGEWCLFRFKK